MANAGTLYVSILAKTGGFNKGMRKISREIDQLRGRLSVASIGVGVGVAAMVKGKMDEISQSAKLADRLGTGTKELAAFKEVAEDSGTSFGLVSSSLQKLSANAGKAMLGNKSFATAFDSLGISAADLASKSPDQIMLSVSDAMGRIENASVRAAVAQKLFGKSGVGLLNFMNGLRDKTALATVENEKLGLSYSRIDAAKVEQAGIAVGNLKDISSGFFTQLSVQLAPKITEITKKLFDIATAGDSMGNRVGRGIDNISAAYNVFRNIVLQTAEGMTKLNQLMLMTPTGMFLNWMSGDKLSLMNKTMGEGFHNAIRSPFDEIEKKTEIMRGGWTLMEQSAGKMKNTIESIKVPTMEQMTGAMDWLKKHRDEIKSKMNARFNYVEASDIRQGSISDYALGFEGNRANRKRKQEVYSPQLELTNQLIARLNELMKRPPVFG